MIPKYITLYHILFLMLPNHNLMIANHPNSTKMQLCCSMIIFKCFLFPSFYPSLIMSFFPLSVKHTPSALSGGRYLALIYPFIFKFSLFGASFTFSSFISCSSFFLILHLYLMYHILCSFAAYLFDNLCLFFVFYFLSPFSHNFHPFPFLLLCYLLAVYFLNLCIFLTIILLCK